jgi:Ni,Fe-hydrogenase III component G
MDTETALQKAEEVLKPWTLSQSNPEENRLDVVIKSEDLQHAVEALLNNKWGYLSAITGLDRPAQEDGEEGQLEALYHFCEGAAVMTIHIQVPYTNPVLLTVCDLIPSASFYEREMLEMFGFEIKGTPNSDRLMLPDIWPEGIYPLRKSFTGLKASSEE